MPAVESLEGSAGVARSNTRRRLTGHEEDESFINALTELQAQTFQPTGGIQNHRRVTQSPRLATGSRSFIFSEEETEVESHQEEGRQHDSPEEEPEVEADDDNSIEDEYEDRLFPEEHFDWEDGKASACDVTTDLDSFTCLSQFSEHLFEDVGTNGSFLEMGTLLQHSKTNPRSRFSVDYRREAIVLRPLITSREIGRNQNVIGLGSYPNIGERQHNMKICSFTVFCALTTVTFSQSLALSAKKT